VRRLQADMQFSAAGERYESKYVWQSLKDWKTYLAMGYVWCLCAPVFLLTTLFQHVHG
jgi:hypothetical protein